MQYTREELERAINDSTVFDTDRERDTILFKTERTALFSLIATYYRNYIYPGRPQEEYGFILIETAAECIKYFDREKGDFLHLLNYAMRRNMRVERAKQMQEERRRGIRLSKNDSVTIRKITALVNSKNLDIGSREVQVKIAKFLNISPEKVKKLIEMNENAVAVNEYTTNEEGDEISIFDTIMSEEGDPYKKIESKEAIESIFETLNRMFLSAQLRTQNLLSMLLTSKIIAEFQENFQFIRAMLEKQKFCSREIFELYINDQKILTARQISEKCGVSEQSASRTLRNFLGKREKYE